MMSKFFSVDSWCLTGYFVLMATGVIHCSCVLALGFPPLPELSTELFSWQPGQLGLSPHTPHVPGLLRNSEGGW